MAEKVTGLIDIKVQSTGADSATDSLNRYADAAEGAARVVDKSAVVEEKVIRLRERSVTSLVAVARQLDTNFRKADNLERATEKLRRAEAAGLTGTEAYIAARAALSRVINDNALAFGKLATSMEKASAITSGMSLSGGMTDTTRMTARMTAALQAERVALGKAAEETGREINARLVAGMAQSGGKTDATGMTAKLTEAFREAREALVKEAEEAGKAVRAQIITAMSMSGGMTDATGMTARMGAAFRATREALAKEAEEAGKEARARIVTAMTESGGMTDTTGMTAKMGAAFHAMRAALVKAAEEAGREAGARIITAMSMSGGMTDATGMTARMGASFRALRETLIKEAEEAGHAARARITAAMSMSGGKADATGMTAKMSASFRAEREALVKAAEDTGREMRAKIVAGMSLSGGMTDPTNMTARMASAAKNAAEVSKLNRAQWANISAQLQDIFVMTASGASPITTLIQQGPQLADVFANNRGGAAAALREFGAVALRVATHPVTILVAAIGSAVAATLFWKNQTDALTTSLNGLGRQSGMTLEQVSRVSEAAAPAAGLSNREARGVAGQMLSAGVSSGSLGGAIGITGEFSRKFSVSLEEAGKELATALADPARGAEELAKKYGLVTFSEREHIKQLAAVGEKSAATEALLRVLAKSIGDAEDPTSRLAKLWNSFTNTLSNSASAWGMLLTEGPSRYFSGAAQAEKEAKAAQKASELAARAEESRQAERADALEKLQTQGELSVRAIQARTYAEREAIAIRQAYTQTMNSSNDVVKASIAAETERAKMMAESVRKVEELTRTSADNARLSRMRPFERRMAEIDIAERDFRRENLPNAAAPMATERNTAATDRNTAAIDGLRASIDHQSPMAGVGIRAGRDRVIDVSRSGSLEDPRGVSGYIESEARRLGIDSAIALRVAQSEGLKTFTGDEGSSFGAFQLHRGGIARGKNRVAGMGDDFMRETGLDPSDPANERAGITYALTRASREGWGAFHGAKRAGIGDREGIRGAPGNDNRSAQTSAAFKGQRATVAFEETDKRLQDTNESINAQRAALEAQAAAFGKSTEEVARATKQQELINQFEAQGVTITDDLRAGIEATAYNYGELARETEDLATKQRHLVEEMDLVRSAARDTLGGLASDFMNGKRAAEALLDALKRIAEKLIAMAADRAVESLFGKTGQAGGGVFDMLFAAHAGGGVVGGPAPMTSAPVSAFVGAPHFAAGGSVPGSGGPVPIIAHAGEVILNAAQQNNVAGALRASLKGANDNRNAVAPVTVNLIGAPQGTKVQEKTDSNGARRVDVVFDERAAAAMTSPQGAQAMRSAYGMSPRVARR